MSGKWMNASSASTSPLQIIFLGRRTLSLVAIPFIHAFIPVFVLCYSPCCLISIPLVSFPRILVSVFVFCSPPRKPPFRLPLRSYAGMLVSKAAVFLHLCWYMTAAKTKISLFGPLFDCLCVAFPECFTEKAPREKIEERKCPAFIAVGLITSVRAIGSI